MVDRLFLLTHTGVTLIMVGVMWSVQLVIYPQFRSVSAADFVQYVSAHSRRIVHVLALFAPLELILALGLWVFRPAQVSATVALLSGLLLAAAWISTGLWYAPLHGRLQAEGHNRALIERLISTNWIRTALWSGRGVLALVLLDSANLA